MTAKQMNPKGGARKAETYRSNRRLAQRVVSGRGWTKVWREGQEKRIKAPRWVKPLSPRFEGRSRHSGHIGAKQLAKRRAVGPMNVKPTS
ncbi:MAG: hypothetical protein KGL39_29555 [Patescibacteria group bacterium]|nr:hypothetical protein [Patescibacteria group bacterium]